MTIRPWSYLTLSDCAWLRGFGWQLTFDADGHPLLVAMKPTTLQAAQMWGVPV